jgi:hypothetical protein
MENKNEQFLKEHEELYKYEYELEVSKNLDNYIRSPGKN